MIKDALRGTCSSDFVQTILRVPPDYDKDRDVYTELATILQLLLLNNTTQYYLLYCGGVEGQIATTDMSKPYTKYITHQESGFETTYMR